MVKVKLIKPFLQVKETLERIGVPSTRTEVPRLYPTCLVVFKKSEDSYFITHFKEMFEHEGKPVELKEDDLPRRNNIIHMLVNWGMIEAVDEIPEFQEGIKVKILKYQEKPHWKIVNKYKVRSTDF